MVSHSVNALILLVEDDPTLGYALSEYLKLQQFSVCWARNGREGLRLFRENDIKLCILDINMPGMDGFILAEKLKSEHRNVPFLFMTARTLKVDKLKGFKLGADDYITKPVEEEEMIARIRAILRRSGSLPDDNASIIQFAGLVYDANRLEVRAKERTYAVTEKEGQLLGLLIRYGNNLLSRETAMQAIWKQTDYFTRKTMDVHIYRLRKLLHKVGPFEIVNVRGKGFILRTTD